MYTPRSIVFAVFCLTTTTIITTIRQTSADVWHMNHLLRKPFWQSLVTHFPDARIRDTEHQTVSVSELFEPRPLDGAIVDRLNLNNKVRQYYNLLTIVCSDALAWNLRYFSLLRTFHTTHGLSWPVNSHIMSLVVNSYHILSAMRRVLQFVGRMYRGYEENGAVAPPLDYRFYWELKWLLSLGEAPTFDGFIETIDEISSRAQEFLNNNAGVVNWRNTMSDVNVMHGHVFQVATGNYTTEWYRVSDSLALLNEKTRRFLVDIWYLGFEYNESTGLVRFIYD